ncbi:MAG: D-2-hydroxyacid dehydrogenase [Clostridia bacterium]|nr:D-2-hydroxyacid dehydrogenase [Clostridia bacterium]
MKILITDTATVRFNNDISLEPIAEFGEVTEFANITRAELLEIIGEFDAVLCNKTVFDSEVLERAEKLKYIGLFATGYNNIDLESASKKGITVCNAGSYSTDAVAQQTFAYILEHFTKLSKYDAFVKEGGWKRSPIFSPIIFPTDELSHKTIGIIGYGSIAKAVEKIALAFNMKPLVFTRTRGEDEKFVSFDELLEKSDIVTVHCPLNEQSREMMNESAFAKMRTGAFFINTARGGVVKEKALYDALMSGKLSGAAIDVLTSEPMREDCVLVDAPNILITPHTAWAPLTTRQRLLGIVCENIGAFLNGTPKNKVN